MPDLLKLNIDIILQNLLAKPYEWKIEKDRYNSKSFQSYFRSACSISYNNLDIVVGKFTTFFVPRYAILFYNKGESQYAIIHQPFHTLYGSMAKKIFEHINETTKMSETLRLVTKFSEAAETAPTNNLSENYKYQAGTALFNAGLRIDQILNINWSDEELQEVLKKNEVFERLKK